MENTKKHKNREIQKYKRYFQSIEQEKTKLNSLKNQTVVRNTFFNGFINEKRQTNEPQTDDLFDINDVKKRNVRVICNVYQERYRNNLKTTGFGDFIRGCYFLLDFCETYNFEHKIIINHPIKTFLHKTNPISNLVNIKFFVHNNCKQHYTDANNYIHTDTGDYITSMFVKYLSARDVQVFNEHVFIYNIIYPNQSIKESYKEIMREILEPTDDIKHCVDTALQRFKLEKRKYIVIQVRTGDEYFDTNNKIKDDTYVSRLSNEIFDLIKQRIKGVPTNRYVLIADNVDLKRKIKALFPSLHAEFNEITHFGEGFPQEYEKVKNTMIDFYLMSCSASIHSYSCYNHGSGFSQWCAETYNIPYTCKLIK